MENYQNENDSFLTTFQENDTKEKKYEDPDYETSSSSKSANRIKKNILYELGTVFLLLAIVAILSYFSFRTDKPIDKKTDITPVNTVVTKKDSMKKKSRMIS